MSILSGWNWTWPALVLAFFLGVMGTRWLYARLGRFKKNNVNKDYFKGLNFLLNEETDKAIEAFIKALEVDDETVELHLALGGLFRRKGQVDRATRIHQNLIARPSLTERQRFEAIYELAQDYYKVGWLDRAEGLFKELTLSDTFHSAAINGLSSIYEQEKEWQQAVDTLQQHKASEYQLHTKKIAHYYCELVDIAIENLDFKMADMYLSKAEDSSSGNPRITLLKGELAFEQKSYAASIKYWLQLSEGNSTAVQLIAGKMIKSYQAIDDVDGLRDYLMAMAAIPKHGRDFRAWYEALSDIFGEAEAEKHILSRVESEGLSGPVANYLHHAVISNMVSDNSKSQLLKELLNRAKSKKIEYTCSSCGFDTKVMYWHCQNCGEWESFR